MSVGKTLKQPVVVSSWHFLLLPLIHTSCLFGTGFGNLRAVVNANMVNILTRCIIVECDTERERLFFAGWGGLNVSGGVICRKKSQTLL